MVHIDDKSLCVGCGACRDICPVKCITMYPDEEGFLYPKVDSANCIGCGKCEKVCPVLHTAVTDVPIPKAYGAVIADTDVREKSSSGGVFSVLASCILRNGGAVCGAMTTEDCKKVRHTVIHSETELDKLRGSKYVQSDTVGIFTEIKTLLTGGTAVLFSGTPCEIKALRGFLGKPYETLVCVDVICHGVPSPLLWEKRMDSMNANRKTKIQSVNFRDKTYGWHDFSMAYQRGKKKKQAFPHYTDGFFELFNSNFSLRPSCYNCKAKDTESGADITLGDFWGVERECPALDDNKGTSMVLVKSEKGQKLWDAVQKDMLMQKEISYDTALRCNPAIRQSQKKNSKREAFYRDMQQMSFDALEKQYMPISAKMKVKAFLVKTGIWKLLKK